MADGGYFEVNDHVQGPGGLSGIVVLVTRGAVTATRQATVRDESGEHHVVLTSKLEKIIPRS